MRFTSLRARFCVAILIGLGFVGVARAQQPREIAIGLGSGSLVAATARIANEIGLFARHGLAPKFTVMDNANAATTALIARSVQAAVSGPAELVIANSRGQRVVMIASAYDGLGGTLVLSKAAAEKTGVAAQAPIGDRLKALDGLLIAAPSPTATYKIVVDGAARASGATVRFTYMAMSAMPAALESGAIQGFIASAPVWARPVLAGSGVAWISGPKGEFPAASAPAVSANVQTLRDIADSEPATMRALQAVFADFARAIDERPAEVKAAIARLYPDIDGTTINLLFASESAAWKSRPTSAADMAREIAFVKSTGAQLPDVDRIDPRALLWP